MKRATAAAIGMGGNLGDVAATFRAAAGVLEQGGLRCIRISSFYRTAPVECPPGTPDFVNAALTGEWEGEPGELLELCRNTEELFGRQREHGYHLSRTLDLDIILFGATEVVMPGLIIPHRAAAERLFVLVPLSEIAGEWPFPGRNTTVAGLVAVYENDDEFRRLAAGKI